MVVEVMHVPLVAGAARAVAAIVAVRHQRLNGTSASSTCPPGTPPLSILAEVPGLVGERRSTAEEGAPLHLRSLPI